MSDWEGPTVSNALWLNVKSADELRDAFRNGKMRRNTTSDEFGRISSKSSSVFTIELIQNLEIADTRENMVLISRANFFDLPCFI